MGYPDVHENGLGTLIDISMSTCDPKIISGLAYNQLYALSLAIYMRQLTTDEGHININV